MLSWCLGSLDYETKYNTSSRACDVSPVSLSDYRESVDCSALQYDDDDEVGAEDNDSKDEVGL